MTPDADLVVTIPPSYALRLYGRRVRMTMGVLTQLFAEASERVVLAAPFMQAGSGLAQGPLAIAANSALRRGVEVSIIGTAGGLSTIDPSLLMDGATAGLRTYVAAENESDPSRLGSHAKFCVADGQAAYVGSANFTGPGLGNQLEIGVLMRGPSAQLVDEFWELARRVGFFVLRGHYSP